MPKLGIGIIGGMGRGPGVGRIFNLTGRAEVRAVADIDPAAFEVGRERFEDGGARPALYTSVAEMLRRDDLDWVIVGTPDRTHYALARQVIESGHNVLVEKPMTQTVAEADTLCDLVRRTGVRLVVGCELRHSAFAGAFRGALREGLIGRPVVANVVDHVGGGYTFYLRDHRRKQWGRGLLMQKGIHTLDLINDFADADPIRVYAAGGLNVFGGRPDSAGRYCRDCAVARECRFSFHTVRSPTWVKGGPRERGEHAFDHCVFRPDSDAEDNMQLLIEYANGFRCAYTAVYFAPQSAREFLFWGGKGSLHGILGSGARLDFAPFPAGGDSTPRSLPVLDGDSGHGGGDEHLVAAIVNAGKNGPPPRPDVFDGRAAVALAEAAQQSIETGQPADIPASPRPGSHTC